MPRPGPLPARPVVEREPERATRAWISGIDGSGSRAVWIVFEGGFGGAALCSVIVNDVAGILEVAGGDVTKKRLERELAGLRASQKLPWVETDPARAVALVREALALHAALGTSPPTAFGRWQRSFDEAASGGPPANPPAAPGEPDPEALDRSVELLDLPDLAGWFLDPEELQSDAVALLQTRESRLVVSDQIKAEREAAIIDAVVERELTPEARGEMGSSPRGDGVDLRRHGPRRAGRVGHRRRRGPARRGARESPPSARARPGPARAGRGQRGDLGSGEAGRRQPQAGRRRGVITDVPGIRVGHATDAAACTGVTAVLCDRPAVAAVELRGGANDVVGLDYLDPRHLVATVNGVVLGGGSRFGGESIWGVLRYLEERGVGFAAGPTVVPHVPGAFLFDLNVGDGRVRPTREMGYAAAAAAAPGPIAEGSVGAGTGASVGKLYGISRAMRGGIGSASMHVGDAVVGAIVAVNALGDVRDPDTGALIAGTREAPDRHRLCDSAALLRSTAPLARFGTPAHTTIGVVATNARLSKAEASKVAALGLLGFARALSPRTRPSTATPSSRSRWATCPPISLASASSPPMSSPRRSRAACAPPPPFPTSPPLATSEPRRR